MTKSKAFVVGGGGETGRAIVEALLQDAHFEVTCSVRSPAAAHSALRTFRQQHGLKIVTANPLNDSVEYLASLLQGFDVVIVAVNAFSLSVQIPLIDASVKAGVKRFVPTNWGTPCPRGGIMDMRDEKEEIHDHIFRHRLGFTIIDVGTWYQVSFPRVPSGRLDYAAFDPSNEIYGDGETPNMLIDERDVGRITAQIIKDPRTLNKRVYCYGQILSQKEVGTIIRQKTGEELDLESVSAADIYDRIATARKAYAAEPQDWMKQVQLCQALYLPSKYLRGDNTPECSEYLGYISAHDLYPDFQYKAFEDFVDELLQGSVKKPYT
ncbi:uncharacterized protein PV06_05435 [Exophiala oligosperma]|uniref:NmrA-like domain-containing protein n=1 Tax=Exophiala oligosperma TaxID=215243 RepID=A0A0D2DFH3_9EURO|nr:uncharacterized protein PV06_05435 [Exophiala oligosperma]KIW41828.1 hypothetical protein PV06_05435 [Exophiala oligosperma]